MSSSSSPISGSSSFVSEDIQDDGAIQQGGYKCRTRIAAIVLVALALISLAAIPGVFGIVGYTTAGAPAFMLQIASTCTLSGLIIMVTGGGLAGIGGTFAVVWLIGEKKVHTIVKGDTEIREEEIQKAGEVKKSAEDIINAMPPGHYYIYQPSTLGYWTATRRTKEGFQTFNVEHLDPVEQGYFYNLATVKKYFHDSWTTYQEYEPDAVSESSLETETKESEEKVQKYTEKQMLDIAKREIDVNTYRIFMDQEGKFRIAMKVQLFYERSGVALVDKQFNSVNGARIYSNKYLKNKFVEV